MLFRIDPPIWLETPKGIGLAHFLCDYGIELSLYWVVAIEATGQCWRFENELVRFVKNYSAGRLAPEKPVPAPSPPPGPP